MAALLWSYAYMVGQVDYGLSLDGINTPIIEKETYFFSAIAIFLFVNVIIGWFLISLKKVKTTEGGSGLRNAGLKKELLVWFKGFAGVINLALSMILFFIGLMNLAESEEAMTLGFYVYLGPILLLIWLVYLPFILVKSRS